jgi:hypothetical protein
VGVTLGLPLLYGTKTAEKGAQTQIYLSATNQVELLKRNSGAFFDNSKVASASSQYVNDIQLGEELWQKSKALTGLEPKF